MKRRLKLNAQRDDLQEFYNLGVRSLDVSPHRLGYGKADHDSDSEGVHPEMLRKARQVAREFPSKEFKKLLAVCKRSEYVPGVSHLMRLASVRKGRQRLINRMIRHRWSLRELNNEIARHAPSVSARGRRRLIPLDHGGRIIVLKRECLRWRRLSAELIPKLRSPTVCRALRQARVSMDVLVAALDRS